MGVEPLRSVGAEPERLWRDVLGERLRQLRLERGQTLADTAARAGISLQYLSEVERGRKEPSSEIIAAVLGALGTSLVEVTSLVSLDLTTAPPLSIASTSMRGPVALAA